MLMLTLITRRPSSKSSAHSVLKSSMSTAIGYICVMTIISVLLFGCLASPVTGIVIIS